MKRYRIPVLFTGGTIGSMETAGGELSTGGGAVNRKLLSLFEASGSAFAGQVDFAEASPLETLSENMTLPRWNQLIAHLQQMDFSGCDGLIITHGSDTLAYTACLLSLLLAGLELPVVLVASNYVLDDPRANGGDNFKGAVEYICGGGQAGVYVCYRSADGRTYLHQGALVRPCPDYSDQFTSATPEPYGKIKEGTFRPIYGGNPPAKRTPLLYSVPPLTESVLALRPFVGLRYDWVQLQGVKAVLHGLYHSCTACVDRSDPTGEIGPRSILWLGNACRQAGIPLYLAPFRGELLEEDGEKQYSTTGDMLAQGLIPLCGMTWEMSYVKLLLAVHLFPDPAQRDAFLREDLCGEHFAR